MILHVSSFYCLQLVHSFGVWDSFSAPLSQNRIFEDAWKLVFTNHLSAFFLFLDCASFSKSVKQGNKGTVNGHAECFYLSDHERACTATNQCNQRMSVSAWNKTLHLYGFVIIKPVDQVLPWFRFSLWKQ